MIKSRCLFIGGPADGKWMAVDDLPVNRIAVRVGEVIEMTDYYQHKISGEGNAIWKIYAPTNWSINEMMHALISGYKDPSS